MVFVFCGMAAPEAGMGASVSQMMREWAQARGTWRRNQLPSLIYKHAPVPEPEDSSPQPSVKPSLSKDDMEAMLAVDEADTQ